MLNFKLVELSDKRWVDEISALEDSPSADFNFGNIYMWDKNYFQRLTRFQDFLVILLEYRKEPFFAFPIGRGDLKLLISLLREHSARQGYSSTTFCGVTQPHLERLNTLFPGQFTAEPDTRYWDYVYSAEKLDTLAGKKLHGKRNHINRFLAENSDWTFRPMTAADAPACYRLLDDWTETCNDEERLSANDERSAIDRAFEHFDYLGLEGGMLYVKDRLVAFTIGEKISSDTYDIHFEKAYADINGAFPMINQQFVRRIRAAHPEIRWINREDDMGFESLRRSKLSYCPDRMIEKYSVVFKNE